MKKIVAGAFVVAFCTVTSLSVWSALSAQSPTFPATGTVNHVANLRSGPGTDSSIVRSVQPSTTVTVTACNADCTWYELEENVWIAAFLVDTDATVPVIAPTRTSALSKRNEASLLPTVTPTRDQIATAEAITIAPTVANAANLRGGPGTNFPIVGSTVPGQELEITGRTEAGDWYQLEGGSWIAAFLVNGAPTDIPAVASLSTPLPAATTSAPISTPMTSVEIDHPAEATATPVSSPLVVEFLNPHYNCESTILDFEASSGITERVGGHRSFQIDLYIHNNGTEPVEPQWKPNRWIITNGTDEMISDLSWQWGSRDGGTYRQPTIYPGQVSGWTWMAFPLQYGEWVKAVEFVWGGETYRQEFDLGPYGNAYNYVDCGLVRDYSMFPTPTPRP